MGALDTLNATNASGQATDIATGAVQAADLASGVVNNNTITISAGDALTGGGNFTVNQSSNETITINHQDTSSQGNVNNSGSTFIQDITLDAYGHVTGITSAAAATGAPAITGVGSYILMQGTRANTSYAEGTTVSPTGNGSERYGVTFGRSNGSGSGDFQSRTSTTQGSSISGGTWRSHSAGVTNQYAVNLMVRIS